MVKMGSSFLDMLIQKSLLDIQVVTGQVGVCHNKSLEICLWEPSACGE